MSENDDIWRDPPTVYCDDAGTRFGTGPEMVETIKRLRAAAETARDYFDRLRMLRATGYDERAFRKAQGHGFFAAIELIAALDGISDEEAFSRWHEAEAAEAERDGRIRAELAVKYPPPSPPPAST